MPLVRYRMAEEPDVEPTYRIFLVANEDLAHRLGRRVAVGEHSPPARALAVRRAALRHDQQRFWVAEAEGRVICFSIAIRRGSVLYLAAIHVEPTFQAKGVGRELLRRSLSEASSDNTTLLAMSEAANLASNGLYGSLGMSPHMPIVQLEGAPGSAPAAGVDGARLSGPGVITHLRRIDRDILGLTRDEDHEMWLGIDGMSLYRLLDGGRSAGYVYVDREGSVGPGAVTRPGLLLPAVCFGLEQLARDSVPVARLRVPGVATAVVSTLLQTGFRLDTGINLLLASRPFGRLDRYLFSGADALL